MRRVTHCTSLEVLALSGRRLSCEAQRVVIDEQHVVHLDLSSGGNVLNLGASFAGLLDRFCGRSIVHSDVVMMREYLSFWNFDVAECSRYTDQLPTGYNVIYDYRSLSASSAPVTSVLVPSSQSSSSSALPVPTLPPAPQLQLAALVPFDGGRHRCPTHEPRNTAKKSDIRYWFFKAAEQGCTQCVEFCVRSHHIDKHVLSNSGKWTALAFARDCGQFAMVDFIAQL